jgi:3-oxoadipate enol-lactonase
MLRSTMPTVQFGHHQVHYELTGDPGQPVITFLNGLTQNANLWKSYADYFVPRGYRVLAYDMLGQGRSSKPIIDIKLAMHADLLDHLLEQLDIEKTHLASISFGGIVGLDFAIRYGHRLHSLTAMSTFAELTQQLDLLGAVMLQGLAEVGLPYLQSMLYPMNMSSDWIAANRERIPAMKRAGYIGNDGYAMQNLMESFVEFKPLTPDLHKIKVPTLIMNGEFDFFTPRECHEVIRSKVKNSRLLIVQRAYHAFTLEMPAVTMRQLEIFLDQVSTKTWQGDQSVWIAADDPSAEVQWLPCAGDWMRAVQPATAPPATQAPARRKAPTRKKAP